MNSTADHARQDIEFHRRTAGGYDDETTREYGIYHAHALRPFLAAAFVPGALAVDLGAGTGVVTTVLASLGYRVVAVDHSPEMLAIARGKVEQLGLAEHVRFEQGDLAGDDVPTDADVATAQGVLHHLPSLDVGLDALDRALRPGGAFFISEPCVEATPIGKAIAAAFPLLAAARRRLLRRPPNEAPPSVEAPISAAALFRGLRERGLEFDAEFATHLPRGHRIMSDRARLRLTLLVSRPWRRRAGDVVFVRGRKPGAA